MRCDTDSDLNRPVAWGPTRTVLHGPTALDSIYPSRADAFACARARPESNVWAGARCPLGRSTHSFIHSVVAHTCSSQCTVQL